MSKQKEIIIKGNWRTPRAWSSTAQWVRNSENTRFYGGTHPRVRELTRVLIEDLYIKVLPYSVAQAIATTPMLMYELRRSVETLLSKYGKLDLVYGDVPKQIEKRIVVDGKNLSLVNTKCTMPVGEFLAWLKGSSYLDKDTKVALSEWSGVPIQQMDYVYSTIIAFFRNETIEEHALTEQYSHGGVITGGVDSRRNAPTNVVNIINPTFFL